jgi:5-methylcytosine-specific restriction protein A
MPKAPKSDRRKAKNKARCSGGNSKPYDARWRLIRKMHMASEPLCRHCLTAGYTVAATEVDHIIPLASGGTHDRSNLQSLCHSCHSRKTGREQWKTRKEK